MVETGLVLDEGTINLIKSKSEFEVVSVPCNDPTTFLQDVARVSPDVIVLSDAGPYDWALISELIHSFTHQETLRVIVLHSENNTLEVYDKKYLTVTHKDDLINLVRQR